MQRPLPLLGVISFLALLCGVDSREILLTESDITGSPSTSLASDTIDGPPQTEVFCGPVEGVWQTVLPSPFSQPTTTRVAAFYSIPYAQPPIGERRWFVPVLPTCWNGTYNATEMKGFCVQGGGGGVEDCLYLHVYVKESILARQQSATSTPGVPVLFYIHGGGLTGGSGNFEDVSKFAAHAGVDSDDGGVVVVTINYRLNIFGFLALEQLSQASGPNVPASNFGLLDQQAALLWVQENIAAFGGDPKRVTVAGQSSGGTSIFGLLSMPASNNLFSGAIALSGSINTSMTIEQGWAQNAGVVQTAGCGGIADPVETVACLRNTSIAVLLGSQPTSWSTPQLWGIEDLTPAGRGNEFGGLIMIDGIAVTHGFGDALAVGLVDVPLIISNMGQECDIGPDQDVSSYSQAQWLAYLEQSVSAFGLPEMANTLYNLYKDPDPQKSYDDFNTDYGLTCGTVQLAYGAKLNAFKSPLYVTVNQWAPSHPIPSGLRQIKYAYHTWDYVAALENFPIPLWLPSSGDWNLSQTLQDTWFTFMQTGSLQTAEGGWRSFEQTPDFPDSYASYRLSANNSSQMIVDYKAGTCAVLSGFGFNQNFEWVD
jgi:carboxylesterase type B